MRNLLLSFLSLLSFALCVSTYVVTSYIEYEPIISTLTKSGSTQLYTITDKLAVTPIASSFSALSTSTETITDEFLSIVEIVLPSGAGSVISRSAPGTTGANIEYVVVLTYTAASSCTGTSWTISSTVPVYLSSPVTPFITPTSTSVSATTEIDFTSTYRYTDYFAFLNPSDIAYDQLTSLSSEYAPYGCASPISYSYGSYPTSYSYGSYPTGLPDPSTVPCSSENPSCTNCTLQGGDYSYYSTAYSTAYSPGEYWLCPDGTRYYISTPPPWTSLLAVAITIPIAWVFFFLIAGLIESWVSFSNLMRGRAGKRGIPLFWSMAIPIIGFPILFLAGPWYADAIAEEKREARRRWKGMSLGAKLRAWLRWGFVRRWPDEFGTEPVTLRRRLFWRGTVGRVGDGDAVTAGASTSVSAPMTMGAGLGVGTGTAGGTGAGTVGGTVPGTVPGTVGGTVASTVAGTNEGLGAGTRAGAS
jgi:hypothetical protein